MRLKSISQLASPALPLLLLSGLALLAAAAAPKETKLQRLANLAIASSPAPISLTDKSFDDLTTGPRNYTSLVLLTALDPRFRCNLCTEFQPEYELLAKNWLQKHRDGNTLFFSYLDFSKGRNTFQKLGLNSAPVLFFYPPTYGPNAPVGGPEKAQPLRYEFLPVTKQAEPLAEWITEHSAHKVVVNRPIDYRKLAAPAAAVVGGIFALIFATRYLVPVITHPTTWAAVSLISILLFTSGHMFNHIRKTPYLAQTKSGQVTYIANGFSTQFGAESQLVGILYAFLAFGTIALAMKVPRMTDPGKQQVAVVVWSAVILCLFSFLMAVFKVKNGSYPFVLPPMMGRL